ncbi:MAG: phospholipid carrier-dependent glycosyltransferase [Candidatus Shapirobacteria bacterium]|nr:phospholipid carrier-dependent glycosyltransferase [Candidatus Shapirobacteria bacterium]MDD3002466.1 phospholipid carrier-dependent glycosyltransferase [Candidatus Shapirobacteria bacterium]MDD4383345.1 phospholipid carrier-dependent glycosyltransferase [Candidatus Shapirobacteria bacterium]
MTKNNKLLLIVIFLIAFFLRFYKIGEYPTLLWDEAAIGYNAYSIIETGKDEYGQTLPIIFKSFGDYKPGLYIYLAIPFVKFLGLTVTATRLPSVIIGSLLPILLFFLIKEINPKSHKTAVLVALITAFNPYSIHFSRGAWETNVLTFELVLASFLFFKYINKKSNKYLFWSAVIFGLSLFTYQAGKMISLFLIIILFLTNLKIVNKKNIKSLLLNFVLPLFIFSIPIIYGLFFSGNANRLKVVSLFSYPRSTEEINTIVNESNQIDYNIFYNHTVFFGRNFLLRYFNNFSPKFLAFEGDWQSPRHSAPYIGVILYPGLIFLFLGIFFALSRPKIDKINIFFLLWLLAAPIPAALTRDTISAVRSMSISIPLVYFISLGIYFIIDRHKNIFIKCLILGVYLISFIYYSDLYLNHMIKKSPDDFLYGYQQSMEYLIKNQNKYSQVVMSDFYGQAYIYYLFYSQYPPQKYQQQAKLIENSSGDTGKVEKIDNIKFTTPDFNLIKTQSNTLAIFNYNEIYRQDINKSTDFKNFLPLSPINNISTFYAYQN